MTRRTRTPKIHPELHLGYIAPKPSTPTFGTSKRYQKIKRALDIVAAREKAGIKVPQKPAQKSAKSRRLLKTRQQLKESIENKFTPTSKGRPSGHSAKPK